MRLYEALVLMDAESKPEPGHEEHLLDLLKRNGASVTSTDRWGERKLAFDIRRRRRGLYFLVHFHAEASAIVEIRRACRLSEHILRELILVDEDGAAKAPLDRILSGSGASAAPGEAAGG